VPFVYSVNPGALQTTNGTANTENDCLFIKPGTTRNVSLQALYAHGKGAGLTAISGITLRIKKWTTTASSAGTAITPTPNDVGIQAAKHTAAFSASAVTSGTGGPTLLGSLGCGAAGPGGWVAPNVDSVKTLEAADNKSIDVFNTSGTISLNFELSAETVE
jgi:hypothetical protein